MRGAFAVATIRLRGRCEMRERRDIRQAQAHKIIQAQRPRFRHVAERVAADVIVIGSVRQRADPHTVEYDPKDAIEWFHAPESTTSITEWISCPPSKGIVSALMPGCAVRESMSSRK